MRNPLVKVMALCLVFYSCASQPQKTKPDEASAIEKTLGNNYIQQPNASNTYTLYQQKAEGDHVGRTYKYAVVRKSDGEMVLSGTYQFGYVKWANDTLLEVLSLPSVAEPDEAKFKKIISVLIPKS